jgi:hypothetical protein
MKCPVSLKTIDNHMQTVIKCGCCFGGVAHLGERLTGSQEVKGSIPFISTKFRHLSQDMVSFFIGGTDI